MNSFKYQITFHKVHAYVNNRTEQTFEIVFLTNNCKIFHTNISMQGHHWICMYIIYLACLEFVNILIFFSFKAPLLHLNYPSNTKKFKVPYPSHHQSLWGLYHSRCQSSPSLPQLWDVKIRQNAADFCGNNLLHIYKVADFCHLAD